MQRARTDRHCGLALEFDSDGGESDVDRPCGIDPTVEFDRAAESDKLRAVLECGAFADADVRLGSTRFVVDGYGVRLIEPNFVGRYCAGFVDWKSEVLGIDRGGGDGLRCADAEMPLLDRIVELEP